MFFIFDEYDVEAWFHERWLEMMMACVSSVNYSICYNSQETDRFTPTRGIRQGGPLSLHVYLLCAEAFSSLLLFEKEVDGMDGTKVCMNAP